MSLTEPKIARLLLALSVSCLGTIVGSRTMARAADREETTPIRPTQEAQDRAFAQAEGDDGQSNQQNGQNGDQGNGGQNNEENGTLRAVDAARNTITVTVRRQEKDADEVYNLTKDVAVFLNGKAIKLGDLKTGVRVTLTTTEDRTAVVKIRVGGQQNQNDGQQDPEETGR